MKYIYVLVLLSLSVIVNCFGQADSVCSVKIGDNYYINCKRIITFQKQSVLTITNSSAKLIKINFDVFASSGQKIAVVKEGKIIEGNKELFEVMSAEKEFTFIEKSTNRIICHVKKEINKGCVLEVWADMYMPSGLYFQCTPETTNVPMLNGMKGATFMNSFAAITLD